MSVQLKIDFVSDISCPWCAIGLHSLEAALARLGPEITADLHFQPFELNPNMGEGAQPVQVFEELLRRFASEATPS